MKEGGRAEKVGKECSAKEKEKRKELKKEERGQKWKEERKDA